MFGCRAPQLLSPGGEQVTELNGSGTWLHSNIWASGKLVATYDLKGIHFQFTDPLGTKRVQANAAGQTDERCTSLPFGNDLNNPPNLVGTSCIPGANPLGTSDYATEHHFTSRERDAETGNDYLLARYYTSALGRFMSPDWSAKVEPVPYSKLDNPQTLNLYAYVLNNPLAGADADGHRGPDRGNTNCASNNTNSSSGCQDNTTADQMRRERQAAAQQNNKAVSTVYNETSGLRSVPGKSTDTNLHDGRPMIESNTFSQPLHSA
jgi:RHS repeat-associated protein